jgi:hypothetical protein
MGAPFQRGREGFAVALCALLGLAQGFCKKPPPKVQVEKEKPKVTLQTARGKRQFDDKDKVVRQFDMNRDGNPDLWKILRKVKQADGKTVELLERMELDINYDGKIDIFRFYNERSELVREEMDLDFDGKIDVAIAFEGGKVVRKELSQGFDESIRIWKHYEDGRLARIERITRSDGKLPDTFELYQDGQLAAVGYDKDGDGKPDVWQRVREGKPMPAPSPRSGLDGGALPGVPPAADAKPVPATGTAPAPSGSPAPAPPAPPAPGAKPGSGAPLAPPPGSRPAHGETSGAPAARDARSAGPGAARDTTTDPTTS